MCSTYSSSVFALRLPSAYCDELANCAIEFIVEYPCFDSPPPNTVDIAPNLDEVCDAGAAFDWPDVERLPPFWNLPCRELPNELGGGTAFIE